MRAGDVVKQTVQGSSEAENQIYVVYEQLIPTSTTAFVKAH